MEGERLPADRQDRYDPHDPGLLRISDADREKVAEVLRGAAGEGRLDLDELDERLAATYAARTYADLVPITADLPAPGLAAQGLPAPRRHVPPAVADHATTWAVMGNSTRRGAWRVPAHHTAFALMGSITLDLRQATLESARTRIDANAVMGDIKVYVDAHTDVLVDGVPIMGDFKQSRDKVPARLGPGAPVVLVKGVALMGSVSVVRLPPPGTPRKVLGTY